MYTRVTASRTVASLTVPGGQEFHFPHFFPHILINFYFFSHFTYFLPHFGSWVGNSPTQEGPGYATDCVEMKGDIMHFKPKGGGALR